MRTSVAVILPLAALFSQWASESHAASILQTGACIQVSDPRPCLFGAMNVDVNGVVYDVSFQDGPAETVFASGMAAATEGDAVAFSRALIEQVFAASALTPNTTRNADFFDNFHEFTHGCHNSVHSCSLLTPFEVETDAESQFWGLPLGLSVVGAVNLDTTGNDFFNLHSTPFDATLDTTNDSSRVWAVWSLAQSVPEPSTLFLLGTGLAVLLGRCHRRVRKQRSQSKRESSG